MTGMPQHKENKSIYDVAIIGAGMAGLQLVRELMDHPRISSLKILLLERSISDYAPRTWCFWDLPEPQQEPGPQPAPESQQGAHPPQVSYAPQAPHRPQEPGLQKSWNRARFFLDNNELNLDLSPFQYHMIDSATWRQQLLTKISASPNITFLTADVQHLEQEAPDLVLIKTSTNDHRARWVFDSRWDPSKLKNYNGHVLYQQFLGYKVASQAGAFDPSLPTLMDFRVDQPGAVAFVYVLPVDSQHALVEYTLFTSDIRPWPELTKSLEEYIEASSPGIRIEGSERGIIPMTDYPFPAPGNKRIIPIGTAGGCTKPSTGYTFVFARQHAAAIARALAAGTQPPCAADLQSARFSWYDSVMLGVLKKHPAKGARILFRLFKKNHPATVLRFLDNKTALHYELKIFASLPIVTFLRSAIRELHRPQHSPD